MVISSKEADIRNNIRDWAAIIMLQQRYVKIKRIRIEKKKRYLKPTRSDPKKTAHRRDGLNQYHQVIENEHLVPNDG